MISKLLLLLTVFSVVLADKAVSIAEIYGEFDGSEILNIDEVTQQLIEFYDNDLIFEAFKLIERFEIALTNNRVRFGVFLDGKSEEDILNAMRNDKKIFRLYSNKDAFEYRYPQLSSGSDWAKKYIDTPEKKLYTTREEKFKGFVTQFFEATVDTNYINLIFLLNCAEQQKQWIPLLNDKTRVVARKSNQRGIFYQRFHPPWMMADREVYVEASSFILPQDNAMYFILDTVLDQWIDIELPRDPELVQFLYAQCIVYLKPVDENTTHIKLIIHANPRIDYVPDYFVDLAINLVSLPFISFIVEMAANLPIEFKQTIIDNYDHFKTFEDYLKPWEQYGKYDLDKFIEEHFIEHRVKGPKKVTSTQNETDVQNDNDL